MIFGRRRTAEEQVVGLPGAVAVAGGSVIAAVLVIGSGGGGWWVRGAGS